MRRCIFCGPTTAPLTKEHLWPEWLSEMFRQAGAKQYRVTRFKGQGDDRTHWHPKGLDISVGGVCERCNNEVLSDLENDFVKPVLAEMAFGKPCVLTTLDQASLAAWITRMVMCDEFTGEDGHFFFSASDRKWFIETLQAPKGTWIWLFQFRSRKRFDAGCVQHINGHRLASGRTDRWTVATGIAGRFGFQFLLRRNYKGAPSRTGLQDMPPVLRRWLPATAQLLPYVGEFRWPPRQHLDDNSIQAFSDRWGGRSIGPNAIR